MARRNGGYRCADARRHELLRHGADARRRRPDRGPDVRRYGNADVIACYENMLHWARTADALGYDTMWLTEHHFQYEGYEVLPNLIMFGVHAAGRTDARCASGRCSTSCPSGTRCASPRTSPSPTSSPAAAWSSASAAARCPARPGPSAPSWRRATTRCRPSTTASTARCSRRRWRSSSSRGATSASPTAASTSCSRPTTCPTGARFVNDLTLVPKPTRPIDIYQPVTSPETIEYVPRAGHKAVYWLQHPETPRAEVGSLRGAAGRGGHPRSSRRGEDRCLVLNVHVGQHPRGGRAPGPARPRRVRQVPRAVRPLLVATGRPTATRCPSASSRRSRSPTSSASWPSASVDDVVDDARVLPRAARPRAPLHLLRPARPAPASRSTSSSTWWPRRCFPRLGEPVERAAAAGRHGDAAGGATLVDGRRPTCASRARPHRRCHRRG